MSSGGGGSKTVYVPQPVAPQRDNSMQLMLGMMQERENRADARAAAERAERKAAEEARKAAGQAGLADFTDLLSRQLKRGSITESDAQAKLTNYGSTYGLDPQGTIRSTSDVLNFYQTNVLPEKQVEGTKRLLRNLLGKEPDKALLDQYLKPYTPAESEDGTLPGGYEGYTGLRTGNLEGLRQQILDSPEYKKTVNDNYLDNYYDTKFGSQVTDSEGNRTKRRTFKFNQNLLPTMDQSLLDNTGISMPDYESAFGDAEGMTVAEIEENLQGVRDTRNFLYNAGLTNLQGEIDTNITKLKTESQERIADMTSAATVTSSLLGGFF